MCNAFWIELHFFFSYTIAFVAPFLRMWSLWMFTIPSLRAKECLPKEKDALNLLFVVTPLLNVILPFVWKSFPFIFSADVVALLGIYYWKGVWMEVGRVDGIVLSQSFLQSSLSVPGLVSYNWHL